MQPYSAEGRTDGPRVLLGRRVVFVVGELGFEPDTHPSEATPGFCPGPTSSRRDERPGTTSRGPMGPDIRTSDPPPDLIPDSIEQGGSLQDSSTT
jgi:hypothetical protein